MGSNPENRLSTPVAKLYEHVTKSRKDFFLKWAHYLCNQADSIFAEALNLKALGRSRLAKYCLDTAWGEFLCFGVAQHKSILSWVCLKRGKYEACSRGQTDQSNLSPFWCPYGEKAAFSKNPFLLPLRQGNPSRRGSSTSGLESSCRKYVHHRAEKCSLRGMLPGMGYIANLFTGTPDEVRIS